MKYVSECAAAKQLSAYVILNPKGEHVATFRAHHGSTVTVNVFNVTTAAQLRCAKAAGLMKSDPGSQATRERIAHDNFSFQRGTAGGGGYDKVTAALSGMIIDGHKMTGHCGASLKPPKDTGLFPEGFKAPKGYVLANWTRREGHSGYMSCCRRKGLEYLRAIGYTVINAI